MTNTTRLIAAAVLAVVAFAAPKLQTVDFAKWLSAESAPVVAGELVIDQPLQLREVCRVMAAALPDLESIDSTNDLSEWVDGSISAAFAGVTMAPETALRVGELTTAIDAALKLAEASQAITQTERATVAGILDTYSKPIPTVPNA